MPRSLVIGMGEVGKGVFDVISSKESSVACRDKDSVIINYHVDVLHICIPHSDEFEAVVKKYMDLYKSEVVIVYSTVPIGTCERLGVVHSPVEGKHPALGLSIQNMARWLGSSNEKMLKKAMKFWEKYGPIRHVPKADFTEFLKLYSTSKYGINIVWAQYAADMCEKLDLDYAAVKQFDLDYNQLYERLGMLQYKRYILDPPEGKIGGHCVVPNAELLNEKHPHEMLKMIMDMGVKK